MRERKRVCERERRTETVRESERDREGGVRELVRETTSKRDRETASER